MKVLLKIFSVCLVVFNVNCMGFFKTPSVPRFDHVWWGPVYSKYQNDTSIRPFRVHFDEEMVLDLRYRLKNHRTFTPPLEGVGFEYGFNTDHLHGWVDYWADQYPFQQQENLLNQYPQFKTNIQGLDMHFLWVKPHVPPTVEVVPLLLLHGFPGSVREFYGTLPRLTAVPMYRDFAVEVIVPSLPGFGFSDMITDLKYRLTNRRNFTPPLTDSAFEYGFNTNAIDSWLTYWAESYNFSERETYLNQFNHYKTNIQGLDIHFIKVTPEEVSSDIEIVPLLLLHGWPGSVREFYKAIPLLTAVSDDRDFAVEVIAPSLPGFGFSDAATRPGLGSSEIAVILRNLMSRLGYTKFYIQGGDWGAYIGTDMCTLFPEEILGFHTNLALSLSPLTLGSWVLGSLMPSAVVDSSVQDRMYPLLSNVEWLMKQTGYLHIQTTKPDTVGVAMADSPAGLLAYILQLFSMATRRVNDSKEDGGLDVYYTRDELLDNLMLYWSTNSFTTSSRLYAETFNKRNVKMGIFALPTSVPMWSMHASDELIYQSPFLLKFKFTNHVNSTILDFGGHFFALEQAKTFSEDVLTAIKAFRKLNDNQTSGDDVELCNL